MKFYILDNKNPKPVRSKYEWETWMYHFEATCLINETTLNGTVVVSTNFCGYSSEENPLLFETVIIGGLHNKYSRKISTWNEAEYEHKRAVEIVMGELN